MKPILFVFHEKCSTGGLIHTVCRESNLPILICRPRFGDPLPALSDIQSAIVFGGTVSVNDPLDWKKEEMAWMEKAMDISLPMLGICLGAQMLAHVLGEPITQLPDHHIECGYYPLHPTLQSGWSLPEVYHWHRERFSLPKGSTLLAEGGSDCPIQAFEFHRAIGVQFHPEVDEETIIRWGLRDARDLQKPGARPWGTHLADHHLYGQQVRNWLTSTLLPHLGVCPFSIPKGLD